MDAAVQTKLATLREAASKIVGIYNLDRAQIPSTFVTDANDFFSRLSQTDARSLNAVPATREELTRLTASVSRVLCRRGHMRPDQIYAFAAAIRRHGAVHGAFLDELNSARVGSQIIERVRYTLDS
jgi:hypothetical protein